MDALRGASHAANNFCRRPELFDGFIALSGKYDIASLFGGYFDENVYNNSPVHYLENMESNHYYIDLYNSKKMFVVGRGAFEHLVINSNYRLAEIAYNKNIHIAFNFWDENSIHDWCSWLYQMPYFIDKVL